MSRLLIFLVLTLCSFLFQTPSYAKKLALVIGNDSYPSLVSLERARNDARAVGLTLRELNFRVTEGYDLGRRAMNRKISRLANMINPGDEVLFFYAGHGVSIDGENYLVPTDIPKIRSGEQDLLKDEAIRVSRITSIFRRRGARISILILDACRNNPFKDEKSGRSIGHSRGLSGINSPGSGTMVIFSAGARQEALDRLSRVPDTSKNSVFTRTLIPLMKQKGLEIHTLARLVRKRVNKLAQQDGHVQTPASYDEILDEYYLAGQGRAISVEPAEKPVKKQASKPSTINRCSEQDKALWARVNTRKRKSDYEFYLKEFPRGCYASLARYEIRQKVASVKEIEPPKNQSGKSILSGTWKGTYSYNRGRRQPVNFTATIKVENGIVTGRIVEPRTFGRGRGGRLYANINGRIVGTRIIFRKRYDGTGGVFHSINYQGEVDSSNKTIRGRWGGRRGSFEMRYVGK